MKPNVNAPQPTAVSQQQDIDSSNKYIDQVANSVLGAVGKFQTIAKQTDDTTSPIVKTSSSVGNRFSAMINKVKALNSDTTKTEDNVKLLQADTIDEGVTASRAIIDNAIKGINTLVTEQEGTLFSRSVDESPRGLSMLGNAALLESVQADHLQFIDNKIVANAVNAFRIYGLLGDRTVQDQIAVSLDNRHSKETVGIIKALKGQKESLEFLDGQIVSAHQLLNSDPARIASIRSRKV